MKIFFKDEGKNKIIFRKITTKKSSPVSPSLQENSRNFFQENEMKGKSKQICIRPCCNAVTSSIATQRGKKSI